MAVMDLKIGENGMRFGVLYSTGPQLATPSSCSTRCQPVITGIQLVPADIGAHYFKVGVPVESSLSRTPPVRSVGPRASAGLHVVTYCILLRAFKRSPVNTSRPFIKLDRNGSEQWILKNVTCEFVVSDILHVVSRDKMVSFNRGVPERAKVEPIPKERTVMFADSDRKTDFEPYSMQSFTRQTNWTGYWGTNRSTGSK
jgi:hypothetical protein